MSGKRQVAGGRCGQALIELCVCMIAIVAVLLAMLELTKVCMTHTTAMMEARADVAESVRSDSALLPTAGFLNTWEEDADGKRYTADDSPVTASAASFYDTTVEQSVSDASEWNVFTDNPNWIVNLHDSPAVPSAYFGLLKGEASTTTNLLPGFQRLIYDSESITIESEVWMTWTKGIY